MQNFHDFYLSFSPSRRKRTKFCVYLVETAQNSLYISSKPQQKKCIYLVETAQYFVYDYCSFLSLEELPSFEKYSHPFLDILDFLSGLQILVTKNLFIVMDDFITN